jgi:tRNA (mo5U34)-methyltransferase
MSRTLDRAEIAERAARIQWFHTMDLGYGIVTPGLDETPRKLGRVRLPTDMTGMSVLDVGAWDGFFSFECERRGAERVVAIDDHTWTGPGWANKDGFDLAREALGSRVEDRDVALDDISPETLGTFDVVLFLGVLYHMWDPFGMLVKLATVCRRLLIVETHLDMLGYRRPAAAFYPGRELDDDESNWWGPNPACVEGMLLPLGFREVKVVWRDPLLRRAGRAAYRAFRPPRVHWRMGRGVFHAVR